MKSLNSALKSKLYEGAMIPAHPLALNEHLKLDEKRQRALTRYYYESGTDGVAVGVHTTQFEIRNPGVDLLEPVLKAAADEINFIRPDRPFIKVSGIVGPTDAALREAELGVKYGYDLGLLSMGGLGSYSEKDLVKRAEAVSSVIPIFGFYLQPAVGGRILSFDFWKDFCEIPNVYAIKVAAFNRYQTLDVVRAVCESSRRDSIALYTGNDDNIVADLITPFRFMINGEQVEKRFVGGLLGHWSVWTKKSVDWFQLIKRSLKSDSRNTEELLSLGVAVTDMNAAIFDPAHSFAGCIAGIHEVLRRQGLLEGIWCLNPAEKLSPGQSEEMDRVYNMYREYTDDEFAGKFRLK